MIMKLQKTEKVLRIIVLGLLVLQLPWYFLAGWYVSKEMTKTTATVVGYLSGNANCTGDRPGRPDWTCDHSARMRPVYEYHDEAGNRLELDSGHLGEFKANNPLRRFFHKPVGGQVTVYYNKGEPYAATFMDSPFAYAGWLLPLYAALHFAVPLAAVYAIRKLHDRAKP